MNKKKIFLVSLGHMSCDINGGALPAVLPYLRSAHHLDYQATGGFMLAYSCLSSLVQPILGLLADRHNKPWFIPLGVFLAGGGLALIGFLTSYWAIFAGITLSGIGAACFHPEGARFANKVSGRNKGSGMSMFSIGGNSGYILGPIVVTFFVGTFGLMGMSVFAIIGIGMAAILFIGIARMGQPAKINSTEGWKQAEFAAAVPQAAEGDELAENNNARPGVNNWREFSKLVFIIISRAIVFAGCNTFIPMYWINIFDQSKAAGAMALVIFGAFGVGFNVLGGFLTDKFGCVRVIRVAYFLMGPSLLIFGLCTQIWSAWLLLPLLGFVLYLPFSAQVVLGQTLLAKNVGFASGVTLGLAVSLGGIAQPCLGWIADSWGLHTIFYVMACLGLLGASFSIFLKKNVNATS